MDAPDFIPLSPRGSTTPAAGQPPDFIDLKKPASQSQSSANEPKPNGFVDRTVDALKGAAKEAKKDPEGALIGAGTALFKGAEDLMSLAMSGTAAIVKGMFTYNPVDPKLSPQDQAKQSFDNTVNQFTQNQEKFQAALTGANNAPADQTEAAMSRVLGIIPDGIHAAGDTVHEKTGSALAAAGTEGLLTLLSFNPGIAADIVRPALDKTRAGTKSTSTLATAFDELAAKRPEAADTVASHIGQVDPLTAKYLKSRIAKFVDASDKELGEIGVRAAEANIAELEGNYETIRGRALTGQDSLGMPTAGMEGPKTKTARMKSSGEDKSGVMGQPPKAVERGPLGEALNQEPQITQERASASIRTTVREAQESFNQITDTDLVTRPVKRDALGTPLEKTGTGEPIKGKTTPLGFIEPPPTRGALGEPVQSPKAVYMNSGIPVTRAGVERAFTMFDKGTDLIPGVKIAKAKLAKQYDRFINAFNPEAKGPQARIAGADIAQNFFEQSRRELQVWEKSKERRTYWQKMGEEASTQFYHAMDAGRKLANPLMEKARLAYKNWAHDMYLQDLKTGFLYDELDHYLPRAFVDSEGVRKWAKQKYGNKWGDPKFIKDRTFELISEAEKAGFTLKTKNPEEMMMLRQRQSDIAELRSNLLKTFEDHGIALKVKKGDTRAPEGYSPDSVRSPVGQRYWIHENIGPLWKNAMDSKSLWENEGNLGGAFRGYMELKNKVVPLKLALSGFHPLHVMHIDNAAHLTRATKLLAERGGGTVAKASEFLLNVATGIPGTPGALWRSLYDNPRTGSPLLKVFQGKRQLSTLTEAQMKGWQYLTESGMIPTRPREEMSSSMQKFKDAWATHSVSAAWHLPWAVMSSLSHPVFGYWIPSLKIASLLKDAEVNMRLNPELAFNSVQRGLMLRDAARKVESRYGEMNYNSMFMNKVLKDIGVATNLSLGWNIGLIDQYAGGAIDLVRAGKNIGMDLLDPNSKGSELGRQIRAGNLDRPIQAALYVSSAMMIGGLIHYFMTGKVPETLIDYTNPKSGDKDKDGKDVRLNTMFYTREFASIYKHTEYEGAGRGLSDFVLAKGSGMVEMMRTALTGVDSLGRDIWKDGDPLQKKVEQGLLSLYPELEPITMEAVAKAGGWDAASAKTKALDFMGFTPAGKYVSQTKTENTIGDYYNRFVRPKETPYDQVVKSKDLKELQEAYTKDDPGYDRLLDTARDKYNLKSEDIRRLQKQFRHEDQFDLVKYQFTRLGWQQQRDLLDRMTPEEREVYLPISNKKHLRNHYEATQE